MYIHGIRYGRTGGGNAQEVQIGQNEKIKEIQYQKAVSRPSFPESRVGALCSLTFITDANSYQIETMDQMNSNDSRQICGDKRFSVQIPNHQDLNSFLNTETIYRSGSDWIIGFKGEMEIV